MTNNKKEIPINVIKYAKTYLKKRSIIALKYCLLHLQKISDLNNPDEVIKAIDNIPCTTGRKGKLRWAYRIYLEANNLKVDF